MKLLHLAIVAAICAAPIALDAQPGAHGIRSRSKATPIERLILHAEEFKLTGQQVSQLEKLSTEFRLASVDQRAALAKAQIRLRDLMRKPEAADQKEVDAAIDQIAQLRASMQKARFGQRRSVMSILTDEQEKLIEEKMKTGMKERMLGRGGQRTKGPKMRGRQIEYEMENDAQIEYDLELKESSGKEI